MVAGGGNKYRGMRTGMGRGWCNGQDGAEMSEEPPGWPDYGRFGRESLAVLRGFVRARLGESDSQGAASCTKK